MTNKRKCLLCENATRSRGLCEMHYNQFSRAKKSLSPKERMEFERLAIEAGRILPLAEPSAFDDLVAQITKRKIEAKENAADDKQRKAAEAKLRSVRTKAKPDRKED